MGKLNYIDAVVWASGEVLSSILPNNWNTMHGKDRDDFIVSAAMDYDGLLSAEELWSKITKLADSALEFAKAYETQTIYEGLLEGKEAGVAVGCAYHDPDLELQVRMKLDVAKVNVAKNGKQYGPEIKLHPADLMRWCREILTSYNQ